MRYYEYRKLVKDKTFNNIKVEHEYYTSVEKDEEDTNDYIGFIKESGLVFYENKGFVDSRYDKAAIMRELRVEEGIMRRPNDNDESVYKIWYEELTPFERNQLF